MKKNRRFQFIFFAAFLWVCIAYGQQKLLSIANNQFNTNQYISAEETYLQLLERDFKSAELLRNLGDCYYFTGRYDKAAKWYQEFIKYYPDQIDVEYFFRCAMSLKSIKDYEIADIYLNQFYMSNPTDQRAVLFNKQRDYLKRIEANSGRFKIKNLAINSKFTDFGSTIYNNKFIFSSSRDTLLMNKRTHKWTNEAFLEIFQATYNHATQEVSDPKTFAKELNTPFHESTPVFSKNGNTVYFTSNYKSKDYQGMTTLKIYKSVKDSNGKWDTPVKLSFNSDRYSAAHPALSPDEKTLYFSSDRPGGYGMSDIYKVQIYPNGVMGEPINLGNDINTEGKETFPFVSENGILYFASDGHPGLGGLDVFMIDINNPWDLINVGKPINSPRDDYAFMNNAKTGKGFFSSNRKEGKGKDDIYSHVELAPVKKYVVDKIWGFIKDEAEIPLSNASVSLYDQTGQLIEKVITDQNSKYGFSGDILEKAYSMIVQKDGYEKTVIKKETKSFSKLKDSSIRLKKKTDKLSEARKSFDFILLVDPGHFRQSSAKIEPDSKKVLNNIASRLKNYADIKLKIKAYGENIEKEDALLKERGETIHKYLTKKGVPTSRLSIENIIEKNVRKEETLQLMMLINQLSFFDFNSKEVTASLAENLSYVINLMENNPEMEIEVHTHTDSRSGYWYNYQLSIQRMEATIAYILRNSKISSHRISGKAFGEQKLVNRCSNDVPCSEKEHQENRRVEFIIK